MVLYYSRLGLEVCQDNTGWCCTTQGYLWKYKSGQHRVGLYYSRLPLEVQVGTTQGGAVLLKARSGSISRDNTGWCCTTQGYLWKYKSGQHRVGLYYSRLPLEVQVGTTQGGAVLLEARSGSTSRDSTGWYCTTQE